ncbi:glycosyltransferase [Gracilibacillus salinarum]|uniref:Glycosyltransferase n=1 Tax=Gracilibacillus salinarum TaxID=2932255 RepID=A0ABY4GRN5_9BACI|nr:glycosyltransferase [Gracilibacillus salinarum]UOQ87053.1 glycosyltransferase [Gracilibacillus salinarum]
MLNKNKKVLVITNMYPSDKHPSFGIFVKNQVSALRDKELDIDVAAIQDQRMDKMHVIKKYLLWVFQIFKFLILNGKKYNVVHAHYVFPSGLFAMFFKRIFGTKVVVTAHGGDIDRMAKKNKIISKITNYILNGADHIIAVGYQLKEEIIQTYSINERKVSIINMGVNRKVFEPRSKLDTKSNLNLDQEHFHILFVGNLIKAKGVQELIFAFQDLQKKDQKIELHLIGAEKEPAFLADLKKEIGARELTKINFYPPKSQKEIAQWMAAADVFVLPSHMEGFGLVALEAMSCHTPVVGSDVGGLSYLLRNNAGIPVQPANQESLFNALEKILTDKSFRQILIDNGEKQADQNKESVQIDKLLNIYNLNGE